MILILNVIGKEEVYLSKYIIYRIFLLVFVLNITWLYRILKILPMKKSIPKPGFILFNFGSRIEEKTVVSDRINNEITSFKCEGPKDLIKDFADEKIELIVDREKCKPERSATKSIKTTKINS